MFECINVVPLAEAYDPLLFGGKASQLCCAVRNGLPIPNGFAIPYSRVKDVAAGKISLHKDLDNVIKILGSFAVRSSAVDEDGEVLSFAGQYTSCLNISTVSGIEKAIDTIWKSAFSRRVLAYKERMGLTHQDPKVGVILQKMIPSDVSGIMFTRNPVTDLDERLIEAAWGLGEAVVSGYISPDYIRMDRNGEIIEKETGNKEAAIRIHPNGGTVEEKLPDKYVTSFCLSDLQLKQLNQLADQCEGIFGQELDIEWAFHQGNLFLLQCRPITGRKTL